MQPVPAPPPAAAQVDSPVDAARERLMGIKDLSTLDQVEAFDAVHRLLQDALASIEHEVRSDAAPGAPRTTPQPGRR